MLKIGNGSTLASIVAIGFVGSLALGAHTARDGEARRAQLRWERLSHAALEEAEARLRPPTVMTRHWERADPVYAQIDDGNAVMLQAVLPWLPVSAVAMAATPPPAVVAPRIMGGFRARAKAPSPPG